MLLEEGDSLRRDHLLVTNPPHKFELPVEYDDPSRSRAGHDNVVPPGINGKRRRSLHHVAGHHNLGGEIPPPAV